MKELFRAVVNAPLVTNIIYEIIKILSLPSYITITL